MTTETTDHPAAPHPLDVLLAAARALCAAEELPAVRKTEPRSGAGWRAWSARAELEKAVHACAALLPDCAAGLASRAARAEHALAAEASHALALRDALLEALDEWASWYEDQRTSGMPLEHARIVELRRLCERPIPGPARHDIEARLARVEQAVGTYHAWLRAILAAARSESEAVAGLVLEAGVGIAAPDVTGAERLIDQPWREMFTEDGPRTCPDHGPHCSGHGTAVIPADGKATEPPTFAADVARELGAVGGGDLAVRRAALVAELRPLAEAAAAGRLWLDLPAEETHREPVIRRGMDALRWLVGMEPEAPAFESPPPRPPDPALSDTQPLPRVEPDDTDGGR